MKTSLIISAGKSIMLCLFLLLNAVWLPAQQMYDDFEGNKLIINYDTRRAGILRTHKNPSPDSLNSSRKCAKYVRGSQQFDNIKMVIPGRLTGVENYASYDPKPSVIKLKIYTTAPVGTRVEIQLGKSGSVYPEGTHSQYVAHTKVSGAWEELHFVFTETPKRSKTKAENINQVTILFSPNTNNRTVYYFDELTGPAVEEDKALKRKRKWFDAE